MGCRLSITPFGSRSRQSHQRRANVAYSVIAVVWSCQMSRYSKIASYDIVPTTTSVATYNLARPQIYHHHCHLRAVHLDRKSRVTLCNSLGACGALSRLQTECRKHPGKSSDILDWPCASCAGPSPCCAGGSYQNASLDLPMV